MTLGQNVPKLDTLHLIDGIEGLRSLSKHSVDMILTDPPYGTTRNFWDVPLPLSELWEAVRWAVKPNGAILFFAQCPFDKVLGASNLAMLRYGCLPLDCPCYMLGKCWTGAYCRYFRAAVLPLDPVLERSLTVERITETRPCPVCGRAFLPDGRQRYCSPVCAGAALREQKRAYMRRKRR